MAVRSAQFARIGGAAPVYHPADPAGDQVPTGDNIRLLVRNASAAAVTLTIVTPGTLGTGAAYPDLALTVPAGGQLLVGPILRKDFGNKDGRAALTWSATASVDFAVFG